MTHHISRTTLKSIAVATLVASQCLISAALAANEHYLVVRETPNGQLSVVSRRIVHTNRELRSHPRGKLQAHRHESLLTASTQDKKSGHADFDVEVLTSSTIRAEFHGRDGGPIEGHVVPAQERFYVVRVPAQAGKWLRLRSAANNNAPASADATLDVDLDQEMRSPTASDLPVADGSSRGYLMNNGDPANRLDILIVAEGYTSDQKNQFIQQATTMANNVLSVSPYSDFKHLINVHWLFVPSNQSGASKPYCAETPSAPVIKVDTAFGAKYCGTGVRRGVTVDNAKVFTAASAVPEWDQLMVLVNDSEYGGSGGAVATTSTNQYSAQIMQHELGHSFSRLADEYDSPVPNYPACSDTGGKVPCEANVTNQTNRSNLKWLRWLESNVAVPNNAALSDPRAAGLWQGARYQNTGMYRQCFKGKMNVLEGPFCKVDSEAFVKRLFGGNWGNHPMGISQIEAGALPASTTLSPIMQSALNFQAQVAGSNTPNGISVGWYVDGVAKQTTANTHGDLTNFRYLSNDTSAHVIELRVTDKTPFMLDAPTTSQTWTVKAVSGSIGGSTPTGGSIGTSIGSSSSGTAPSTTIKATVPGSPNLSALRTSGNTLTLMFAAPASDGGSAVTSYTAQCNVANHAPYTHVVNSATPITFTGLVNGTYSCVVRATNAVGTSTSSNSRSASIWTWWGWRRP